MMILESGSVAKDRILQDDIVNAFNTVLEIVSFLKTNGLIKEDPQFNLGSTKIAYRIFQKKLNKVIDDIDNEDLNKAELKRLEDGFGDLDIDIVLVDGVTLDDVETKITEKFGDKIWKVAPKGERAPGQLHYGFKIGNKVHQVDFVELKGEEDRKVREYFSGSSATDEAHGIKGLFNKEMHYALSNMVEPNAIINTFAKKEGKPFNDKAKEYDILEKKELAFFTQEIKDEKISKNYVVQVEGKKYPVVASTKGKLKLGGEITDEENIDVTPSMEIEAAKASFVIITRRKVSLIESKLQEKYGITFRLYLYRQKFKESEGKVKTSLEAAPKKVVLDYIPLSEPDSVIKVLLGDKATTNELFSAVETAKYIGKNFADDEKLEFWDMFVEQAIEKRNKPRVDRKTRQPVLNPDTGKPEIVGQVDEKKYDASMRLLGKFIGMDKILGDDFYVLPKSDTSEVDGVIKETYNSLVFNEAESIRTGIGRFDGTGKVSGDDFLKALKALYPYVKEDGSLHPNEAPNIDIVEKVDSSFCHFGVNKEGKFFLASSNSGEVTEENFEHKFKNNPDFLESFRFLKDHKLLHVVLKNISKEIGKPVKFEAEILPILTYTPDEAGNVTFVGTKYSKEKLGEKGAFVVFKAQVYEGDEWIRIPSRHQKKMISDVVDADSKEWRILSNDVHMKVNQDVNFGVDFNQLDKYLGTDSGFKNLQDLMDAKMTPEKRRVKEILSDIRAKMQVALDGLSNSLTSNIGNDFIEGVVLRIKDEDGQVMEIKGTSEKFSKNKETLWKHRDQLEELYDNFKNSIKTNVLHLKLTTDRSINQTFLDTLQEFDARGTSKEEVTEKFMVAVINKLIDKNADFSNVKKDAVKIVREYKGSLNGLKQDFKANAESFDVNSARKTKEAFSIYGDKFETLFNILLTESDNDLKYVLDCFNAIYEGKAKNLLGTLEPETDIQTKKCALWVGRAQPWHKGHDAMVKIGLNKAEVVFVVIVKGTESGQNQDKNPMSAETQKELIRSLYPNGEVIVCDNHPTKASLPFIMVELDKQGLEAVAWLVGEDRKEAYKGEITRFNFSQWSQGHKYVPVRPNIEFVITPRLASATDAREMAKQVPFEEWVKNFAPEGLSNAGRNAYKKAYAEIRGPVEEETRNQILENFKKEKDSKKKVKSVEPSIEDTPDDEQPDSLEKPEVTVKPEEKELYFTNKETLAIELRSLLNIFDNKKTGIPEETIKTELSKFNDPNFAPSFSPELKEAIKLILESIEIPIIEENPDKELPEVSLEEKRFLEQYFAEIIAPLALKYPNLITNKDRYDEISTTVGYDWISTKAIKYPKDVSNNLYDSILIGDFNHMLISSKNSSSGAAASINTLYKSFNELDKENLNPEYVEEHAIENKETKHSALEIINELLNKPKTEIPLKESTLTEKRLITSQTLWAYSALVLAKFTIGGFTDQTKNDIEHILDFVRKTVGNNKINDYEIGRKKLWDILKVLPEKQLVMKIRESLNRKDDGIGYVYGVISVISYYAANKLSESTLAKPISNLLRELLTKSSIMQMNATYENNVLKFKLIHPLTIKEGLIKLDGGHNYFRASSKSGHRSSPSGGIAFKLPN
jgi:hypothetical protein